MLASAGFRATGVRPPRAGQFCAPATITAHCRLRGLLMVDGAERDREFVADFEPKAPGLGEADVMGVAWRSPANETRLPCHEAQMLLSADPLRFADGEHTLVDLWAPAFGTRRIRSTLPIIKSAIASIFRFNERNSALLQSGLLLPGWFAEP